MLGNGVKGGWDSPRKTQGLGFKSYHSGTSAHRDGDQTCAETRQLYGVVSLPYMDSRDPILVTRLV